MKYALKFVAIAGALALASGAHAESKKASESSHGSSATQTAAASEKKESHGAAAEESAKEESHGGGSRVLAAAASTSHGDEAPHWAYEGDIGPAHWAELSEDFHACAAGLKQSPINVDRITGVGADAITFDYNPSPLRIVHNGHTIQVNYGPGSGIQVDGKRYELLQLHFHLPSEHAVFGQRSAMETHFVHKAADGELAVVGVMMDVGGENLALREIWHAMPREEGVEQSEPNVVVNGRDMLPDQRSYFRYAGSLTTPPCSEGLQWFVLKDRIPVGTEQAAQFFAIIGENARPLQNLENRLVLGPLAAAE